MGKLPCLAWAESMHPSQRHRIHFWMPMGCLPAPTSVKVWACRHLGHFSGFNTCQAREESGCGGEREIERAHTGVEHFQA